MPSTGRVHNFHKEHNVTLNMSNWAPSLISKGLEGVRNLFKALHMEATCGGGLQIFALADNNQLLHSQSN